MLRFASFRIRNNTSVENFANNLDLEDIRDILNQKRGMVLVPLDL